MYLVVALKRFWQRNAPPAPTTALLQAAEPPKPAEVVKFDKPPGNANTGIAPDGLGRAGRELVETLADAPGVKDLVGDVAGLAKQAVQVTRLAETVLDKGLGAGEGRASLAALGAPAIVAVGAAQLTRNALDAVGFKNEEVKKTLEQAVAAGPFAPAVLMAHAASAVLGAISPEADKAVRGLVAKADITDPSQPAGKLFQAATSTLKNLLGGEEEKAPPPDPAEVAKVQALLAQQKTGGITGLISAAQQVQKQAAAASPPPSPAPAPPLAPIPLPFGLKAPAAATPAKTTSPVKGAALSSPFGIKAGVLAKAF